MFAFDAELGFEGIVAIVKASVDNLHKISQTSAILSSSKSAPSPREGRKNLCEQFQFIEAINNHTSEFRLLVSLPTIPCFSINTTCAPSTCCNRLAIANPIAPPPTTACVKSALRLIDEVNFRDWALWRNTAFTARGEANILANNSL